MAKKSKRELEPAGKDKDDLTFLDRQSLFTNCQMQATRMEGFNW